MTVASVHMQLIRQLGFSAGATRSHLWPLLSRRHQSGLGRGQPQGQANCHRQLPAASGTLQAFPAGSSSPPSVQVIDSKPAVKYGTLCKEIVYVPHMRCNLCPQGVVGKMAGLTSGADETWTQSTDNTSRAQLLAALPQVAPALSCFFTQDPPRAYR